MLNESITFEENVILSVINNYTKQTSLFKEAGKYVVIVYIAAICLIRIYSKISTGYQWDS